MAHNTTKYQELNDLLNEGVEILTSFEHKQKRLIGKFLNSIDYENDIPEEKLWEHIEEAAKILKSDKLKMTRSDFEWIEERFLGYYEVEWAKRNPELASIRSDFEAQDSWK